jgi:hypothetical protein
MLALADQLRRDLQIAVSVPNAGNVPAATQ